MPVACSVSDADLSHGAAQVRTRVMARAEERRAIDGGMTFHFPYDAVLVGEIVATTFAGQDVPPIADQSPSSSRTIRSSS